MEKSTGIFLESDLLDSEAFQSLNGTAFRVLFRFLRKRQLVPVKTKPGHRKGYLITNNGEIEYSYAEAESRDGIYPPRFRDALSVLIDRGFISVAQEGGLMRRKAKYRVHVKDDSEPWRSWKK